VDSARFAARFLRDAARVALIPAAVITLSCGAAFAATPPRSQFAEKSPEAAFGVLAGQITGDRASGGAESEALQEQALEILDRAALEQLNGLPAPGSSATRAAPDLNQVNMRLASFVTHQPPIGEAYRVARLGGNPSAYALVADFGLSGPSAVRVYAGAPGSLALAARIDRYAQKDFFDDYTELVTLPGPAAVFVTVTGRTDDLQTGFFTAWYFDGSTLSAVWSSDILERSSYEVAADGFRLTYCADNSDAAPGGPCHTMQRDRYLWQSNRWERAETTSLPPQAATP
jgi:hypothetical protein